MLCRTPSLSFNTLERVCLVNEGECLIHKQLNEMELLYSSINVCTAEAA